MTPRTIFAEVKMASLNLLLGLVATLAFAEAVMSRWRYPPHVRSNSDCPSIPAVVPLTARDLEKTLNELSNNITYYLKRYNAPGGVAVGLVYDQKLIWAKGFGKINDSDPQLGAPTETTGFRIGSVSKVFTDIMMYQLRDAGILPSLDMDITQYNNEFSIINPFGKTRRGITFQQLSCHLSGLQREMPCAGIYGPGCNVSYSEIYKRLSESRLDYPPGWRPSYSNLGIGLLGRTLEKVLEQVDTWEDYVIREIVDPLGMKDTGSKMPPKASTQMAVGYLEDGSVASYVDMGFEAPAGQMYSSVYDLAQLMMLVFRDNQTYNPSAGQILDAVTIREWMHPAYMYFDQFGFGHPWELLPYSNYTLVTKDGAINGYLTEYRMAPQIKTGVILLQSSEEPYSHNAITQDLTNLIGAVSNQMWEKQPKPYHPPNAEEYIGNFSIRGTQNMAVIFYFFDRLTAYYGTYYTGDNVELRWYGEKDVFQMSMNGMSGNTCRRLSVGIDGAWMYFHRDAEGKIDYFEVPGQSYGDKWSKLPG